MSEKFTEPSSKGGRTEVSEDVHTDTQTNTSEQQEGRKTLDELLSSDKALQSEFDRKVTGALNKAKEKWEQQARDDADEAKKLEKMTAEEKEKYQFAKDKEKFAEEKRKFAQEKLKNAVASELVNRGYSAEFAEFLTGSDAEISNSNINAFDEAFKKAVEKATADKLRGDTVPPAQKNNNNAGAPPSDFHEYEKWRQNNK